MELKVGMYVRTDLGEIDKLITKSRSTLGEDFYTMQNNIFGEDVETMQMKGSPFYVVKSSFNIVDLIEIGDIVNNCSVVEIRNNYLITNASFSIIEAKEIKTVLTHEQYEANCYKIGE